MLHQAPVKRPGAQRKRRDQDDEKHESESRH
jgi:hypothetical protein